MPNLVTVEQLRQLETSLLGRTNIRPRSITEDKLAVGAASAAVVRDGSISDVHIDTLSIGTLTVSGVMQTGNFSTTPGAEAGWRLNADGTAEFYQLDVIASISGGTIDIGGSDSTSFHVDASGQMWLGSGSFGSAPFRVTAGGAVTATSVTVTGTINATGGIISGATGDVGSNALQWDAIGNLWSGAGSFGAAPFSVSATGALTASSVTVSGTITAQSGSALPVNFLTTGSMVANLTVATGGWIRSNDWVSQTTGWAINPTGVEINAGTLDIGGSDASSFHIDASGNTWWGAGTLADSQSKIASSGIATFRSTMYETPAGHTLLGDIDVATSPNRFLINAVGTECDLMLSATDDVAVLPNSVERARFYESGRLNLNTDVDVNLVSGSGTLTLGPWAGSHMALDANEIQAKSNGTTASTLNLNVLGGDVLIGVASSSATNQTFISGGDTTSSLVVRNYNDLGSASANGVTIIMGNDTNDPGNDDDFMLFRKNISSGATVGSIDGDGSGGVRFNVTSDRRLKRGIRPSEGARIFDLIDWRSYEMDYRESGQAEVEDITRHGPVAQEMWTHPELRPFVHKGGRSVGGEIADPWSVNRLGLVDLFGAKVAQLEERLAVLEAA